MSADTSLPKGFEDLEKYVAAWALDTELARARKRRTSSMTELKEFYDAMVACAPQALDHLNAFPFEALPAPERRLMCLTLSLAEVSTAVEMFGEPEEQGVFDMFRFRNRHANSPYS